MEKQNLFPKDFCKQNDSESVLDTLYWSYFDRHPMDSVEISRRFSSLADILGKLPLKEHDQVWDLTCALCTEHEKKGIPGRCPHRSRHGMGADRKITRPCKAPLIRAL